MKKFSYIVAGMALALGLGACEMRDELKGHDELAENEGYVSLDLRSQSYSNDIVTRGVFAPEELDVNNYTVRIVNKSNEQVVKETTYRELTAAGIPVKLTAGQYRVEAFNFDGALMGASQRPYFKGQTDFSILPAKKTTVNTTCRLHCMEVFLVLDPSFLQQFKDDYAITVSNGSNGNHIFRKDNIDKKAYFSVPANASSISMTVKATVIKTGANISQNYVIEKPQNAEGNSLLANGDAFKIKLNPGDNPSVEGVTKYDLGITVDLTWRENNQTIEIPTDNIIFVEGGTGGGTTSKGDIAVTGLPQTYNIDLAAEVVPTVTVDIKAPNGIQKMLVKIQSNNAEFMRTLAGFGLDKEFDLANPGDLLPVLSGDLATGQGIGLLDPNDPIKGKTAYTFNITSFMTMLKLYGAGENTFSLTISDGITPDVSGDLKVILK